jgi:hypothetical protein
MCTQYRLTGGSSANVGAALLGAGLVLLMTAVVPWLTFQDGVTPSTSAEAALPVLWGLGFASGAVVMLALAPARATRLAPATCGAAVPLVLVLALVIANRLDLCDDTD